ncbi:MAG: hypothetical protein M0Q93_12995, partial [Terrimicrobiaceae bacterium]|nr:hypothetical protein [Terrimicrobiaceae bacterium]
GVQAQGMLAEEHPECLHSQCVRATLCASQRYLTADVRQKYMLSAKAHFEIDDSGQRGCRGAMMIRTTERLRQEYPETGVTATISPDRRDLCHSKNIPEPRIEMIPSFPNSVISTGRQKRTQTQARFHTPSDHDRKRANRAVDLTTGTRAVSSGSVFDVRPLRHRACEEQSRPSAFAVHPCIPYAPPPVAGHRRRSAKQNMRTRFYSLLAILLFLPAWAFAFEGILGPYETVERLSFTFVDSHQPYAEHKHYTFALSRNQWPPNKDYYFTLNNEKIVSPDIEAKMMRCYELATVGIRNFRTNPPNSPRGIENFISISINGQPGGIIISFWKGALVENPALGELQSLLESVIPNDIKMKPNKAVDSTATRVTPPAEQEPRHGQP